MSYTLTIIDNPADPTFNQLLSINDVGEIAGYYGSGATGHPNKGYTVTETAGGPVFVPENYPTSVQTQVTGIDNAGQTVGFEIDAAGNSYGFVDNDGVFSIAVDPRAKAIGGIVTEQFLGVNDRDQVAGFYVKNKAGDTAGFIYNEETGKFSKISISNATSVTATDINDKDAISGFFTRNGKEKGFLDINGKILVLSHPGWTNIQALGLNDAGLVVGSYMMGNDTFGFVYNTATGVYTTVSEGAGTETVINGVNDLGDLVGFYMDSSGNTHGMLLTPPAPTSNPQALTIDNLTDPTFNQLLAINNAGEIAGYFGSGAPGHPNNGYTATLQNGAPVFVNENYPGSTQTQVTGINNSGLTVGFEIDAAGNSAGFVHQANGAFQLALDPNAPTIGGIVSEQFLGVNDRNQVAGFYVDDAAGDTAGFIYNDQTGTFSNVSIHNATSVTATDINDKGDISGFFTRNGKDKGFVDVNGHIDVLTHPGWKDIQALGLNNDGLVVGSYVDSHNNTDGFLYSMSNNSFTSYIAPGDAGGQTVLNGINDLNQAVGFYMDASHNTHGLLVNNV